MSLNQNNLYPAVSPFNRLVLHRSVRRIKNGIFVKSKLKIPQSFAVLVNSCCLTVARKFPTKFFHRFTSGRLFDVRIPTMSAPIATTKREREQKKNMNTQRATHSGPYRFC